MSIGSSSSSVYFPSKYHGDSFYNTEKNIKQNVKRKGYTGRVLTKSLIAFLACDSDLECVIVAGAEFQSCTEG